MPGGMVDMVRVVRVEAESTLVMAKCGGWVEWFCGAECF